jgi:hypothetical protein
MTVLNEPQRCVLTYIQAVNHGGYSPTPAEVIEWELRRDLKRGKVIMWRIQTPGLLRATESARHGVSPR